MRLSFPDTTSVSLSGLCPQIGYAIFLYTRRARRTQFRGLLANGGLPDIDDGPLAHTLWDLHRIPLWDLH